MSLENEDEQEEISSIGMKGMIGAVLMATKEHKVTAPMESYLTRNHSRFHFSHDFASVNIGNFLKDIKEDFNISANEKGSGFLKSNVAKYLYRPKELEDTRVYDFLAKYTTCKPTTTSFNWAKPHPSKDDLKIKSLNTKWIPVICYLDFVDTQDFGANDIFSCDMDKISTGERGAVEENAKKCCVLFIPFRNLQADVKLNECFFGRMET